MDYLNLVKDSGLVLQEDISTWPDQLQSMFEIQYPTLANYAPSVELVKIDRRGYGYGSIIVRHGNIILYFPVIINTYKVAPIDTFILNNRYFPADNRILSLVFSGTFGPVAGRTSDDQRISNSMTNFLFSPYYFPVGVKNASSLPEAYSIDPKRTKDFITKIAFSLTNNSIKSILAKLSDPTILNVIKNTPTVTDFLTHLTNIPDNAQLATRAAVTYPKNIVQFRYDNGNYYILLNSSDMYSPTEVNIPSGNIRDAVRQLTGIVDDNEITNIVENVVNDGMLTATLPTFRTGTIKILDDASTLKPVILESPGNAIVQDENGKYRTGTIFTSILEFADIQHPTSLRQETEIFISANSFSNPSKVDYKVYIDSQVSMISDKFIGFKVSDRSLNVVTLPSAGDFGVLLDSSSGSITEPFLVISTSKKVHSPDSFSGGKGSRYVLNIQTIKGTPYTITYDAMSGSNNDVNFVPIKRVIGAGRDFGMLSPDISDPITIMFNSGKFAMNLPEELNTWTSEAFGDYAPEKKFRFNSLTPKDVEFLLISGGASAKEASAIKHYVSKKGSADIVGLKYTKPTDRELRIKYASMLKKSVPTQQVELVKLAADIGSDDATVSEVFSLSLLTPENASEFIENIPTYNLILHNISKYIIFSRMALKSVDLTSAIKLRNILLDVIQSLVLLEFHIGEHKNQEYSTEAIPQ
jgi:hypothetical protein